MKNILLPTDYSATANNAFIYALHLANRFGVKLYVLYSYTAPVLSSVHAGQPDMLTTVYQEIEQSKHDFSDKKNKELLDLAHDEGLDTSQLIFLFEHGAVLPSVKKVLEEGDISLVVMGILGNTADTTTTIGSNTVSVIRNIDLPVLAVPLKAKFTGIKKIAFTTLFREKDYKPLEQIVNISNLVDAHVYCVNVMNEDSNTVDNLAQSNNWSNRLGDQKLDFVFLKKNNPIEEEINTYIKENDIDVLAVVRRNRSFFDRLMRSNITNKLTLHTEIPIFVFYENAIQDGY